MALKKIFKVFPMISLLALKTTGAYSILLGLQGYSWQDLCRGPLDIAIY